VAPFCVLAANMLPCDCCARAIFCFSALISPESFCSLTLRGLGGDATSPIVRLHTSLLDPALQG